MAITTIELVLVLAWSAGVAFASYRIGYSEGHNDATIYGVRTGMEGMLDEDTEEDADF